MPRAWTVAFQHLFSAPEDGQIPAMLHQESPMFGNPTLPPEKSDSIHSRQHHANALPELESGSTPMAWHSRNSAKFDRFLRSYLQDTVGLQPGTREFGNEYRALTTINMAEDGQLYVTLLYLQSASGTGLLRYLRLRHRYSWKKTQ